MKADTDYLKYSWKYVLMTAGIFIISLIAGLVLSLRELGLSENYIEMLRNSFEWIKTLSPIGIMLVIFLNNAIKSCLTIVLGAGFGIVPVLFVGGNGLILGLIANETVKEKGIPYVLAALAPHGIIEIPMILISAGLGLRLGYFMYLTFTGEKKDIMRELIESLRVFVRIIMPLLFVSAAVETFVTPAVVLLVSG